MSQYFSERPDVASDTTEVDVVLQDLAFTMLTDRGVFSHGHLDIGTSLLLREAPTPPASGDLLDLGCGAGAIALTLAKRSPDAVIWAVDINARARDLTRDNAARNAIANVRVASPDEVPADVRFAAIWSNPPIRIGKAALHELLIGWLGRLGADAEAILVVQKHLGADTLQRWLTDHGFPTDRVASKAGFRLLRTRRPLD